MRSHLWSVVLTLSALTSLTSAWAPDSNALSTTLHRIGMIKLIGHSLKHPPSSGCRYSTVATRHEWHTLTPSKKTKYIDAVLCLQSKPPRSGAAAPGAKSRYDDFVATHINQTLSIHATGNFLSWHRYFIWTFEQALRNECGYDGSLPYLDWAKIASDPLSSPLFDDSATSISGNGEYKEYAGVDIPSPQLTYIHLPPGEGGGCVTGGPFKNLSVNLGPVVPVYTDLPVNPQADGLGYNPRCLRRDITNDASSIAATDRNITALILQNDNIADFQNTMQGDFPAGEMGVHAAGHNIVAGDGGGDIFNSPADPFFWLHHGQIDRVWSIWQNQDLENRIGAIAGTITVNNDPPSRDTTLTDLLDMGVNSDEKIEIKTALHTIEGKFCYIYV